MSDNIYEMVEEFRKLPSCSTGGPLHIVTDDYNVRDTDLSFVEGALHGDDHWVYADLTNEQVAEMRNLGQKIIDALYDLPEDEREAALR
jgi:hypothetical protein